MLNVDVSAIRLKRNMLDEICPEAINILRNSPAKAAAFVVLKEIKPARQIEAAEYMKATNTFSHLFAKSLLAMTHPDSLVGASPGKKIESSSVRFSKRWQWQKARDWHPAARSQFHGVSGLRCKFKSTRFSLRNSTWRSRLLLWHL